MNNEFRFRHLPPEHETGNHYFSGKIVITTEVNKTLTMVEIANIVHYVRELAKANNGVDCLQVFQNKESEQKLFFINQLDKDAIESGRYGEEDDYATLLYSHEY